LKKAFTLIEVMVSTLIVFLVIFAVMNSISNVKYLLNIFSSHKKFELISSIAFLEEKKSKNLYEKVLDFNIKNDEIIHTLKKYSINIEKKPIYSMLYKNKKITIYKIKAYDKTHSNFIYSIGVK